jgi:ElaB/YqjD/DUF883 family membrane-anchored ribosome-binding protein
MENSGTSGFAKTGQTLADKATDKVQSGVRVAQDTARDAGNILSTKLDDVRSEAGTVVKAASSRVQSMGKQGLDAISDAVGQARDMASDASDSVIAFTKKNPVTALAIAAASGALLYAVIKASIPSRD